MHCSGLAVGGLGAGRPRQQGLFVVDQDCFDRFAPSGVRCQTPIPSLDAHMTKGVRPHPENAAGPFYVEDGCCTACGVPEAIAPELFAWDGNSHCFVKRQPVTPSETDKALQVVAHAELSCIRYRGLDPEVLVRFAELGEPGLCDFGARLALKPIVRDHVAFDDLLKVASSPSDIARHFRDYLLGRPDNRYRVTEIMSSHELASFDVAWFEDKFHHIAFSRGDAVHSWLVRNQGNRGVSSLVQDWLVSDGRFSDIQWYTASFWKGRGSSRSTPW